MNGVTVAATQMACSSNRTENIDHAENLVETACKKGAQIILLQELFETGYFCQEENRNISALPLHLKRTLRSTIFQKLQKAERGASDQLF